MQRDFLCKSDIAELLRQTKVRFVVADVGRPLTWISEAACFDFWKQDAKTHLSDAQIASLADFPAGYFYFASLWDDGGSPIILLSKNH